MSNAQPLLTVAGLTKRYPGVTALDDVDLEVPTGEIHALVGENGAGKSTLAKCLSGVERPDAGAMTLAGAPHAPASVADALRAGVQVVHQELTLLPYLSVAENVCLQRLPRRFGMVDRQAMDRQTRELLDRVGLDIAPRTRVERLGIAQMQLVEIAKALATGCKLLVLDEPTATLTSRETATLFGILRQLSASGVAVVYISHHLEEIFDICDRVTVLRNGAHVTTAPLEGMTSADLVRSMVGRDIAHEYPPVHPRAVGDVLLDVHELRVTPTAPPVSFSVRAGEVVGVAGLVGAGRTEVMRAIFGADKAAAGEISFRGIPTKVSHPRVAVDRGVSFLTEDRKSQGLVLDLPITANISLASLHKVSHNGLLSRRAETATANSFGEQLQIKANSVRQHPRALSGGNQQKVVLGRWLAADTELLIVDEPTRGIDVGARYEIHKLLLDLADAGKAVLVVSSDLPELLGICDRLLVLSRGRISGELSRAEFDEERVLSLAYAEYLKDVES